MLAVYCRDFLVCNSDTFHARLFPRQTVLLDRRVPPLEVMQRLSPLEVAYGRGISTTEASWWVLMAPPQKQVGYDGLDSGESGVAGSC
jgi:hypothetical protein